MKNTWPNNKHFFLLKSGEKNSPYLLKCWAEINKDFKVRNSTAVMHRRSKFGILRTF